MAYVYCTMLHNVMRASAFQARLEIFLTDRSFYDVGLDMMYVRVVIGVIYIYQ